MARGERKRGMSVDVKNETTRCERIDEPALLKRACIRAAEMKEEKRREKESHLHRNVQPRDPSSEEYKITFHSFDLPFSFFLLVYPPPPPSGSGQKIQKRSEKSSCITNYWDVSQCHTLRNMQMLESRVTR